MTVVMEAAEDRLFGAAWTDGSSAGPAPVADTYLIGGRDLWRPLRISLVREAETEQYLAVVDEWAIAGVGDTAAEAIEDLRLALGEYRAALEAAGGDLGSTLADQLEFLREHVRPIPER